MSKLYNIYTKLKKNSDTLLLFKSGIFFIFLDEDAKNISPLLNLKLTNLNSTILKCGFPINSLEKYEIILKQNKILYTIIDISNETCFSFKTYSTNEQILNLLTKLSSVSPEFLSVKESYDFISEIKKIAQNIKGERLENNILIKAC